MISSAPRITIPTKPTQSSHAHTALFRRGTMQAARLMCTRFYVPQPEIKIRFGSDINPMKQYENSLISRTNEVLARGERPRAKGLFVAVGIKAKDNAKVWCEAVEGEISPYQLERIEEELAHVEALTPQRGPVGFAMEVSLFGQRPVKYPIVPQLWIDAMVRDRVPVLVSPPDTLFTFIWPD